MQSFYLFFFNCTGQIKTQSNNNNNFESRSEENFKKTLHPNRWYIENSKLHLCALMQKASSLHLQLARIQARTNHNKSIQLAMEHRIKKHTSKSVFAQCMA